MFCDCGVQLGARTKFCPECGQKSKMADTSVSATGWCPNTALHGRRSPETCGARIEVTQRRCGDCGWAVDPKIFRGESKMCDGVLEEDKLCVNILTFGDKFCSECGKAVTIKVN